MMALGLGHRAGAIHKVQGCLEIGKEESLLQVMAIHDFPIGKLRGQLIKRLAFKRGNSAAARHTALIGEITHPKSTQTSVSRNSTGSVRSGRSCSRSFG